MGNALGHRHVDRCRRPGGRRRAPRPARATADFSSTVRARSIEPPMVDRLAIRASRLSSTLAPAPTPMTTIRPPTAISGSTAATFGPAHQLEGDVVGPVVGHLVGVDHLVGPERGPPRAGARRLRTEATTWAPAAWASCTAAVPTPPAAPETSTRSPARQPGLGEQGVVGGGERLGEPAGLGPSPRVGRRAGRWTRARTTSWPWPPPPVMAITRSPGPKRPRVGPRRHHLAGELQSRDVGRRPGRGRVEAPALHQVGGVDAGGAHRHQQVAGAGLGVGMLTPDSATHRRW